MASDQNTHESNSPQLPGAAASTGAKNVTPVTHLTRRLDHSVPDVTRLTRRLDHSVPDVTRLTRRLDHSVPDPR
ncbi:hypothetical protein ACTMTU_20120 [Streptomyces sp. OZ13]|uniref:hypothetical protein n=1 Tax=Streptomyces sp. OZ13 TaxID=3452210 RepID=UPI003F8AE266